MKKKVLATLLTATLAVASLSGCGSNGGGATADSSTPAPAATEEQAPAAADDSAPADDTSAADTSAAADASDPVSTLIANTSGTVTLRVWASEEDQALTTELLDKFKSTYSDVTFDITLGSESESTAKDTVLTDVEAAADVYAFADDQINELVQAGALQEVAATYTDDVKSANASGSVEAASVDGK